MITSSSNPHIKFMRALHDRKGREAAHAFLVEGIFVLAEAIQAGIVPDLVAYEPDGLQRTEAGRRLLRDLQQLDCVLLSVSEQLLSQASDTTSPPGIVAALSLQQILPERLQHRRKQHARPLTLLLDGINDPGNAGTLLRSALAADVDAVFAAPGCTDLYAPKVIRAASGAHFHLPLNTSLPWSSIQARLAPIDQVLLAEAGSRSPFYRYDLTRPTVLILGNEVHGPSLVARSLATALINIPLRNGVDSLNAGVAGSILLFESLRQRDSQAESLLRENSREHLDNYL